MPKAKLVFILVSVFITGCASGNSLYTWGKYESSLYNYYKKPATADDYMESLDAAIALGEKRDNVAPGLYAEAGYIYLSRGDSAKATEYFQKEKDRWPQSAKFMDSMIRSAQLSGPGEGQE